VDRGEREGNKRFQALRDASYPLTDPSLGGRRRSRGRGCGDEVGADGVLVDVGAAGLVLGCVEDEVGCSLGR
jgi:hypothetical protein